MAFICTQDLKDEEYINSHYVIMATKKGQVKKTSLEQYSRPRSNGINAITIKERDVLLEAKLTTGQSQVVLAVRSGKAIRFEENKTRPMGRNASGVRGIRLADDNDARDMEPNHHGKAPHGQWNLEGRPPSRLTKSHFCTAQWYGSNDWGPP